jgi:hypothetical protein
MGVSSPGLRKSMAEVGTTSFVPLLQLEVQSGPLLPPPLHRRLPRPHWILPLTMIPLLRRHRHPQSSAIFGIVPLLAGIIRRVVVFALSLRYDIANESRFLWSVPAPYRHFFPLASSSSSSSSLMSHLFRLCRGTAVGRRPS